MRGSVIVIFAALLSVEALRRDKRQIPVIPGLGGPGGFAGIPGLGSFSGGGPANSGGGIAGFPGIDSATIIQPAPGKPCPVALVPRQFGGGLKFGNPFNFGLNLKGHDKNNGPWGTSFDTDLGQQYGGSIFGDAGPEAVPLECRNPDGPSPGQSATASTAPTEFPPIFPFLSKNKGSTPAPVNTDNPIARVLAQNPDLLRQAVGQNPDLVKSQSNRAQVEEALRNNPDLIRQTLLANPELIKAALNQEAPEPDQSSSSQITQGQVEIPGGGSKQGPAPRPETDEGPRPFTGNTDQELRDAVYRKLAHDPATLRAFAQVHGDNIRKGLRRKGVERSLSDDALVKMLGTNPHIIGEILDGNPGLVQRTATKYRITKDWDAPLEGVKWSPIHSAVYSAMREDPFFMQQVLDENPNYFKASLLKGKFDVGDLTEDQIKQTFYNHPEFMRNMLARDGVFTNHIHSKYGVKARKTYVRPKPSKAEIAYRYMERSDGLMEKVFSDYPRLLNLGLIKQGVDPDKVKNEDVIMSYKKHPEMLKLLMLQNPDLTAAVINTFKRTVRIRTGQVVAQVDEDDVITDGLDEDDVIADVLDGLLE